MVQHDPYKPSDSLFGQAPPPAPEQVRLVTGSEAPPPFTELQILGMYTPATRPLESFYLPLLSRAITYDRVVGYWSAAEIRFAAEGVAAFLANGGHMRLIVGAQLADQDVAAVLHGVPLDSVLAERMLSDPAWAADELLKNDHLAVLAWMIKAGRLEMQVGVPTDGERLLTYEESGNYFHSKFGVLRDSHGNQVAFSGSNNSTMAGWMGNHETFDTYPSWLREVWERNGRPKVDAFQQMWAGMPDPGWKIVSLPTAVREHLIRSAPERPPLPGWQSDDGVVGTDVPETSEDLGTAWARLVELSERPRKEPFTAAGTAPMEPLPHQAVLVHRVVTTYPRGYLFADEVGLGKTLEAGLVVRELMLSGRAKSALLLVPASVMKQWQEELHEKVGLDVPRYDGQQFLDRHDRAVVRPVGKAPWCAFPVVLASSHLARRASRRDEILDAGPWDIVFIDEAHHARRRGSKANDTPNALLRLLIDMRARDSWKALYLASATPMQMNQHEAWDLISLFSLPGMWGESARNFLSYYDQLREDPSERNWRLLSNMLADYFKDDGAIVDEALRERIEDELGWVDAATVTGLAQTPLSSEQARHMAPNALWAADAWLRRHTPMRDRVFRNTRATLRAYKSAGLINATIPVRHVNDEFIDLETALERPLYDRIESYIRRHYNAYKTTTTHQALGFIMTVYRRRLTSSFEAIRASLRRRLTVLEQGQALGELLADDDMADVDATLFDLDDFDTRAADLLSGEIDELRDFLKELDNIQGEDTKATRLVRDVTDALMTEPSVVVFTQYTDTLDYIRERLVAADHRAVACYSGRGGELYNVETGGWDTRTKTEIKQMFREGRITVLLGTDAMSEGLNLQTSGRVINYDVPWNLMRVEQRIGRVDRIGGRETVLVTNYFYADTVEQRVYDGILGDFEDFTDIIGNAQPVLADIEKSIEQLALAPEVPPAMVDERLGSLKEAIADAGRRPVQLSDFGEPIPGTQSPVQAPPSIEGQTTANDLQAALASNPLTRDRLVPSGPDGVFRLRVNAAAPLEPPTSIADMKQASLADGPLVTFDWRVADGSSDDIEVLTYGNAYMEALLPARLARD